jgi:hypothetical protein
MIRIKQKMYNIAIRELSHVKLNSLTHWNGSGKKTKINLND